MKLWPTIQEKLPLHPPDGHTLDGLGLLSKTSEAATDSSPPPIMTVAQLATSCWVFSSEISAVIECLNFQDTDRSIKNISLVASDFVFQWWGGGLYICRLQMEMPQKDPSTNVESFGKHLGPHNASRVFPLVKSNDRPMQSSKKPTPTHKSRPVCFLVI